MRWWKKAFYHPAVDSKEKGFLDELASDGVQVVLFVSRCRSGTPCAESMMLNSGRIPINLAEQTPLPACTNPEHCQCEYKRLDSPFLAAEGVCGFSD
jgi:hypothetical protein